MITYRSYANSTDVNLDNKLVGEIRRVDGGYQYFPLNHEEGGEIFPTLKKCKESLESD